MTPLEKINSMKMPFAELKGVAFTEAGKDRVVARMLVRPDLCTAGHTIHGGAIMALADSVGAAATVINLPADANGTTTLESKTNFIGGAKEGGSCLRHVWVRLGQYRALLPKSTMGRSCNFSCFQPYLLP